jgi:hypothetical protein
LGVLAPKYLTQQSNTGFVCHSLLASFFKGSSAFEGATFRRSTVVRHCIQSSLNNHREIGLIFAIQKHSRSLTSLDSLSHGELKLSVFAAAFISDYVTAQLKLNRKHQDSSFQRGVAKGLVSVLYRILAFSSANKFHVKGAKIICDGKWTKTKTERKQHLKVAIGSVSSTTFKTPVAFSVSTDRSRFGAFSVKV